MFKLGNNISNKSSGEQWNIYAQYIFSAILQPTIGEVIESDVMSTFLNFQVSKINPGLFYSFNILLCYTFTLKDILNSI
jgi:hypothetical protein